MKHRPLLQVMAWRPDTVSRCWGLWFRVCGYGLHVSTQSRSAALFSERYGYRRVLYVFGVRIEALGPR